MNPYLFQIIYCGWVIWFAYLNRLWIESNSGFRHWANAISHLCAAGIAGYNWGWEYAAAILFLVRTLFDGSLSVFRGLSFEYVSPKPSSRVDIFEKKIFGKNGLLPKLLYFIIALLLNVLHAIIG